MHAVASEAGLYSEPCLYCQLDEEDEEENIVELCFVPPTHGEDALSALFEAFNQGASLNPDPVQPDQEGEGDWIFNEVEVYGEHEDEDDEGEGEEYGDAMDEGS